ncbi:Mov34/MPN/PAD-1 family protein [Azospirillum sp. RU38E]|uniref:Mov34/MPN/PAD-1 family protein n=1 Tax=unclassified Azospirillum TaxID=2630922 RepID=UPI000B7882D9
MAQFTQPPEDTHEAGGLLLGCLRGPHIEVRACTPPMATDARSRYMFHRRDPGHQITAVKAWRESGQTITCIGEWHTHPESIPSPSGIDRNTWRTQCRRAKHPLVYLILGRNGNWSGLGFPNGEVEPVHEVLSESLTRVSLALGP